MSAERAPSRTPRKWSLRSTSGELGFALFGLAVASGLPLLAAFDIRRPYDSLALLLLTNPAGTFFRNAHYWSAQLFLVATLVHTWAHLRHGTELRVKPRVWVRVVVSLPLAGFVMLSGFILRGDAESQQAARVLSAALDQLPVVGRLAVAGLLGTESDRQILYVHHAASASLLVWLFVAEHARALWPRRVSVIEAAVGTTLAALFLTPTLHDGLDAVVKGPWYFVGLQEALHWLSRPAWAMLAGVAVLGLLVVLPRLSDRLSAVAKAVLVVAVVAYASLTIVGLAFRGEAWAWGYSWTFAKSGLAAHGLGPWRAPSVEAFERRPIPVVLGRREGCLFCHAGTTGLAPSHAPDAVGCASCHGGNPFTVDAAAAHARMVLVPGNLADAERSCGTPRCHPGIPARVSRSLMNTMAGVIEVDRELWGRTGSRDSRGAVPVRGESGGATAASLGRDGADGHLRQLCASCHLGGEKRQWGAVGETSRGGGCNACHLTYSKSAGEDLARYLRSGGVSRGARPPAAHPSVALALDSGHCFGCHSRSGRIATSYEGWHELEPGKATPGRRRRTLEDGRVFEFVQPDVHAERGMQCVDCHTSREVMGDGTAHRRKADAVRLSCEDCHVQGAPRTVAAAGLDAESATIARLRGWYVPDRPFLQSEAGPLLGAWLDAAGKAALTRRAGGKTLDLRAPAPVCTQGRGHARLSCISCHSAWAPRCVGCHTRFDPAREGVDLLDGRQVRGEWVEDGSGFSAEPPTLGLRLAPAVGPAAGPAREVVDTFIPGMVVSLDRNEKTGSPPDTVFRRLYARAFSHTISRSSRSCRSCHADPVALGYGTGELTYRVEATGGRWQFRPTHAPGPDGLPLDAWTGFLAERAVGASTRRDVRTLGVDEQKRVLTVGACLTCHEPGSRAMQGAVEDWRRTLASMSPRCVAPRW
jgi:hypothetical protein